MPVRGEDPRVQGGEEQGTKWRGRSKHRRTKERLMSQAILHRNTETPRHSHALIYTKISAKEFCMEVQGETKGVLTLRL